MWCCFLFIILSKKQSSRVQTNWKFQKWNSNIRKIVFKTLNLAIFYPPNYTKFAFCIIGTISKYRVVNSHFRGYGEILLTFSPLNCREKWRFCFLNCAMITSLWCKLSLLFYCASNHIKQQGFKRKKKKRTVFSFTEKRQNKREQNRDREVQIPRSPLLFPFCV